MAVEIIQSIGPNELGPQKHIEGEKTQQQAGKRKTNVGRPGDDVQISDRAKALNEEFETMKARALSPSDDQKLRIENAKQRIASGFYFQDDVLEQTAGKILDSETLTPASIVDASDKNASYVQAADSGSSADKITRAKIRAAEGFYQQNEVLKVTAEKIIRDLTV